MYLTKTLISFCNSEFRLLLLLLPMSSCFFPAFLPYQMNARVLRYGLVSTGFLFSFSFSKLNIFPNLRQLQPIYYSSHFLYRNNLSYHDLLLTACNIFWFQLMPRRQHSGTEETSANCKDCIFS